MINESNFHIYLDDFVSGLLDEEMELAFVAFLDKHPGILDGEELKEPELSLDDTFKAGLKKQAPLDKANTDEWLIASLEGDLKEEDERKLKTYLEQYPQLEKDKALFALTVLKPEREMVFPNKAGLKRRPALYLYARWSSAVAAVLLLGFLFFRPDAEVTGPVADVPEKVIETAPGPKEVVSPAAVVPEEKNKELMPLPGERSYFPAEQNTREKKQELASVDPRNMDPFVLTPVTEQQPSYLPVEEERVYPQPVAMAHGQSVWQWAYKKIRKTVGEEELILPERQIPGDALNLVLSKVAPSVQYDKNEDGSVLRIGSFEINRKTAKQ